MSKITIDDILASFASTTSINARFNQVQNEFNNKVFYRDNPSGEPNQMEQNLDMNGYAILNTSVINVVDPGLGISLTDAIGYAKEWADNPEDLLVSANAGGNTIDDYSALHHSAKSQANVVLTNADVLLTNSDVITTATDVILTNADVITVSNLYDLFDDRYLGDKASPPTLDNDGDTLLTGAMYFNNISLDMWIWNGAAWGLIGTTQNSAASVTLADSGNHYPTDNVEIALQDIATSGVANKGANIVGIEDSANHFTGTNIEDALKEVLTLTGLQIVTNKIINSSTLNSPNITGYLYTLTVSSTGTLTNSPPGWTMSKGATGVYTITHNLAIVDPSAQLAQVQGTSGIHILLIQNAITANSFSYTLAQNGGSTIDTGHKILFSTGNMV